MSILTEALAAHPTTIEALADTAEAIIGLVQTGIAEADNVKHGENILSGFRAVQDLVKEVPEVRESPAAEAALNAQQILIDCADDFQEKHGRSFTPREIGQLALVTAKLLQGDDPAEILRTFLPGQAKA